MIRAGYPKSGNTRLTGLVAQACDSPAVGFRNLEDKIIDDIVNEVLERGVNSQ